VDEIVTLPDPLLDIIVVGYRPGPETWRLLEELPGVTRSAYVLHYFDNTGNPKNLSEAWNDLCFEGKAPYIAVLNSDALPSVGWDAILINALEDPTIGSVNPEAVPAPSGTYFGLDYHIGMPPSRDELEALAATAWKATEGKPVLYDYGSENAPYFAVMFRRRDFEELCGFDERLRFYAQDHDFQDRLRQKGQKITKATNCPFYHGDSVSTKKAIESGDIDIMEEYKAIGRVYYPIRSGAVPRWHTLSAAERAAVRADPAFRMSRNAPPGAAPEQPRAQHEKQPHR
jgi:hypothetical protein